MKSINLKTGLAEMLKRGVIMDVISDDQPSLGIMDISIHRNAYGRQVDSFMDTVCDQDVAFIRAPIIQEVSTELTIKTKHQNHPTWVIGEKHMVTTLHPELSTSTPSVVHEYFIQHVQSAFDKMGKITANDQ